MIIAHLSDTHLDGGARADDRLVAVMAYLNDVRADVVVVTGDIADHGLPEEYRRAAELLKHPAPVLVLPGNHDVRGAFRAGLLDEPPSDLPIDQAREAGGVLFALCDSTIPGRGAGYLADATLDWLDGVLSEGDGPAVVAFHHPPIDVGIPRVDAIRQSGEDRLAELLGHHPRVVALLAGHIHSGAATTFAGLPLRMAPGVVSGTQVPVEPGGDRPVAEGWPVDLESPPAVLLHHLHDDGRVTSHQRVVRL